MISFAFTIEPLVPGSGHLSSIAVSSASTIAATPPQLAVPPVWLPSRCFVFPVAPQFKVIVRGAIDYCCADPIPTTPIQETVTYNTDLGKQLSGSSSLGRIPSSSFDNLGMENGNEYPNHPIFMSAKTCNIDIYISIFLIQLF